MTVNTRPGPRGPLAHLSVTPASLHEREASLSSQKMEVQNVARTVRPFCATRIRAVRCILNLQFMLMPASYRLSMVRMDRMVRQKPRYDIKLFILGASAVCLAVAERRRETAQLMRWLNTGGRTARASQVKSPRAMKNPAVRFYFNISVCEIISPQRLTASGPLGRRGQHVVRCVVEVFEIFCTR